MDARSLLFLIVAIAHVGHQTPLSTTDQSIKLELSETRQTGFVTLAARALSVYCGERSVCCVTCCEGCDDG